VQVAGIDVSTHSVDIVLLDEDDTAEWTSVPCADDRGPFFAARLAAELMPRGTFWDDVYLAGIERPFTQNRGTARALGLITGAVASCLPRLLTALETAPQEWKRVTVGGAKASKQDVARWVSYQWVNPPDLVTQDGIDAFAIAWAARALNEKAVAAGARSGSR
jgi:hypothetical protein